jgi:glucose/arabinose dehydrogenase
MRNRRLIVLAIVTAVVVGVIAIGSAIVRTGALFRMFGREVAGVLAPTAVPLPTATQPSGLPTATPAAEPDVSAATATQPPSATQESEPADTSAVEGPAGPTRVVPPQEPVSLPPGFGISVFASGLSDPRMMALGPDAELYVAERGRRRVVRLPDRDRDGVADGVAVVADGLNAPSSIAFHPDGSLYVGETTRVLRLTDPDGDGVFAQPEVIVDGLPSGGHNTRTVLFSPDGSTMYVSVGSSCNVCDEVDPRRATIVRYNPDGTGETIYAAGLRNAVGITFRPGTDELWATNNGRDWLGDDQPPETVYLVLEGDDAGWPRCHSGRIEDPDFGGPGSCDGVAAPAVEMQAHSAPLGLTFYSGDRFPEEYRGDLFVAFHGSWNRTTPTGYKVVRIPIDGGKAGVAQDFAVGWLHGDGSQWGRPVDVITGPEGSLFVSDDGGGAIYRVYYEGP